MYRKDSRIIGEWLENSNKALLVTGKTDWKNLAYKKRN